MGWGELVDDEAAVTNAPVGDKLGLELTVIVQSERVEAKSGSAGSDSIPGGVLLTGGAVVPARPLTVKPEICPLRGWRLGGVGTFGVVACVQEVTVTPGERSQMLKAES